MTAPTKNKIEMHTFAEALELVLKGERVTRLEWADDGEYGLLLSDGFLGIRHEKKLHSWKVHESDINATDWVVV